MLPYPGRFHHRSNFSSRRPTYAAVCVDAVRRRPLRARRARVRGIRAQHLHHGARTGGGGAYAPYGLETKWPVAGFAGRFLGYNTKIRSIYIQPTAGYQVNSWLKVGIGWAYITSKLELHQRVDLSTQQAAPSVTFAN